MTYLIYDGSFDGLLSAIFDVYALKLNQVSIQKAGLPAQQLFSTTIESSTDETKSNRVRDKIINFLGKDGLQSLWKATLSEIDGIENTVLGVAQYALKEQKNILGDFGHPDVLRLQDILKKINRERHRMTAFVRFELANDGVFYAVIEPDFYVLPLIAKHFEKRYADQRWLIFDTKRNYGIFYDLQQVITVEIHQTLHENSPAVLRLEWDESEKEFQKLWKNYFKSTNIASRKNTKLHLQHVPRRYWKYLVEKH